MRYSGLFSIPCVFRPQPHDFVRPAITSARITQRSVPQSQRHSHRLPFVESNVHLPYFSMGFHCSITADQASRKLRRNSVTGEENTTLPKTWTREIALAIFGLWTYATVYLLHFADAGRVDLLEPTYAGLSGMAMIAIPFLLGVKAAQGVADRHSRRRTNPRLSGEGEHGRAG
jgi:hypothetical protein